MAKEQPVHDKEGHFIVRVGDILDDRCRLPSSRRAGRKLMDRLASFQTALLDHWVKERSARSSVQSICIPVAKKSLSKSCTLSLEVSLSVPHLRPLACPVELSRSTETRARSRSRSSGSWRKKIRTTNSASSTPTHSNPKSLADEVDLSSRCIHLIDTFDYKEHVCIVSELLSASVFDFLKENQYQPFPFNHIQDFARQLLGSVCCACSFPRLAAAC